MRLEGCTQAVGVLLQLHGLQWGVFASGESQEVTPRKLGSHRGLLSLNALSVCGSHQTCCRGPRGLHSGCSGSAEPLQVSPSDFTPDPNTQTPTMDHVAEARKKAHFLFQCSSSAFFCQSPALYSLWKRNVQGGQDSIVTEQVLRAHSELRSSNLVTGTFQ